MGVVGELRSFVIRGNVVDMAIGIVIGVAFGAVITAMVGDLITPLIGIPGHMDFSGWKVTVNGSTFMPGAFLNAIVSFVLIALVIFFVIVKPMNTLQERAKAKHAAATPTMRDCPYCLSEIPIKAVKCRYCASTIPEASK